jgi:hypothetical protein
MPALMYKNAPPHEPLNPSDLERLRVWLARQPLTGRVSVYAVLRLLATLDAERGLAAEDAA